MVKHMPHRIGILLARYSNSGVPRVQLTLAHTMASRGLEVDLVLVKGTLPNSERLSLPASVRVVELGKTRVASSLVPLTQYFRRTILSHVIAAEYHLNVVAMCALRFARRSTRVAISFHVPPGRESLRPHWQKLAANLLLSRVFFAKADALVAISSGMADELADSLRIPRARIEVIHNPVVHERLITMAEAELEPAVGGEFGFILGVGRLSPNKGFADLIEAFSLIQHETKLNLVILGEGVDRARLEARVRELDLEARVRLPGAVDNPYSWMANAHLFISASYFEGLSNVIIEALACGCPVVATDCPSGPSEILKNGRYGRLVDVGDVSALAQAMRASLAAENRDRQHLKARANDFHADRIVDQYLNALGTPRAVR